MTRAAPTDAIASLRDPKTIRERCEIIFAAAEADRLDHFALDVSRLDATADYVIDVIRASYPDLDVPFHSRWRHFSVGSIDRWAALRSKIADRTPDEQARVAFDLVVPSVLLDAGAGPDWRYQESETGQSFARSEGLAVASFDFFVAGALSAYGVDAYRADAAALSAVSDELLAHGFQAGPENPLVGVADRAALLRRLGEALTAAPDLFGLRTPRIGNLYDTLADRAEDKTLSVTTLFAAVLEGLGPVWPARIEIDGIGLGDVGRHSAIKTDDRTDGLVPFHKLSQWLTYSLIEPMQTAGFTVTDLDSLTGLPEYRNGGLFIDSGVLSLKDETERDTAHDPMDEIVVEWRALTVALLDRLADRVRAKLGLDAASFPLVKLLEGGTWRAGRQIAREKRPGGEPPLRIISDGTLF